MEYICCLVVISRQMPNGGDWARAQLLQYSRSTVSSHRLRVRQKILCCDRAVADDNDRMTDHDESIAEHYNCLSCATAMGYLARTTRFRCWTAGETGEVSRPRMPVILR